MIAETFESMDEELRNSGYRRRNWVISRRDETSLITSLGTVRYCKTLFKNKKTGACEYLLDRIMGLESHVRMTEDAQAQMLEEAVDSSYRKGGIRASLSEKVSKQTVKNKIHDLKFHTKPEMDSFLNIMTIAVGGLVLVALVTVLGVGEVGVSTGAG